MPPVRTVRLVPRTKQSKAAKGKAAKAKRDKPPFKLPVDKQLLDSTAFPHILERIVDLAPFVVHLELRLVSKNVRDRVDKLLWRHVAVGTPADWDTCEICEPFPPYNRLPGEEMEGPQFSDWDSLGDYDSDDSDEDKEEEEEEIPEGRHAELIAELRRVKIRAAKNVSKHAKQRETWGPWNYVRLVDHYGAKDCTGAFDFPDATVRYMWPTHGFSQSASFVDYIRIPQSNFSTVAPMLPYTQAKSYVMRTLVDVPAFTDVSDDDWNWTPWRFNYHPETPLPCDKMAYVLEVVKAGPNKKVTNYEDGVLRGAIACLDHAVAASLYLDKHVVVAGLERIPLHIMYLAPSTEPEELRERVIAAVRIALRERVIQLAEGELTPAELAKHMEKMAKFTLCTFEEWAATANPGEVTKPDIDVNFLGNPAYYENRQAPQLPWGPMWGFDYDVEDDMWDDEDGFGMMIGGPGLEDFDDEEMGWDSGEEEADDFDDIWGVD